MVHEGLDARAMEKRGIPTEAGERNREIRQQNKLIDQLEARLARLNAWAQFEKKLDETLIAEGKDVSDPNLRYILASRVFSSTVQPKRKDHRLRDGASLLAIMQEYNITDAASCAAAVQQLNTKLYSLRSKRKENHDLSVELSARMAATKTGRNTGNTSVRGRSCRRLNARALNADTSLNAADIDRLVLRCTDGRLTGRRSTAEDGNRRWST